MTDTPVALRGQIVRSQDLVADGAVIVEGGRIAWVGPVEAVPEERRDWVEVVRRAPRRGTVIPGLVDVHCHGGGGASFPDATTPEEAMTAVTEHRAHGTTSLVASLVTAAPGVLLDRASVLADLAEDGEVAGIHFEGPFVSAARCGAQDPRFIVEADPALTRGLLGAARGHTVTMTLAPEGPRAFGPGSAAQVLVEGGALPSWGHTDADPASARAALEYSRRVLEEVGEDVRRSPHATVTHLFNGMRPLHHRDPGPIAEFLSDAARGGAVLELICDGVHLDPSIVRDVWEIVGRDSCVFVTDAMAAAGMADGSYRLGPQSVTVRDGVARLAGGGAIAGGTSHLLDCVRVAVQRAGIPLVDAVHMASAQGAAVLGDPTIGRLAAGCSADLVVLDDDLRVLEVIRRGSVVR